MRNLSGIDRLTFAIVLSLALTLAPAAWAAVEQAREQGAAAPAASKPAEQDDDSSDTEPADGADSAEPEACPPTFNTVEDIHAHTGPASALLSTRLETRPTVVWLPVPDDR